MRGPRRKIGAAAVLRDAEPLPTTPVDVDGSPNGFNRTLVPLGGGFASGVGGYIDAYGTLGVQMSLDVGRWRVRRMFEWAPLCCSGSLGATDRRQVGYDYQWQAEILWDYRCPADAINVLRTIEGLELVFWLGEILAQQLQAFQGVPSSSLVYPFLWCPNAVLETSETMLDALGKKMTRVPCQGSTRAHLWVCPAEGTPGNTASKAGAYNAWYGGGA